MIDRALVLLGLAALGLAAPVMAQRSTPVQLFDPAGANDDQFGSAVAASGDTIVVGAALDDVGANTDWGSAHVYRWTGTTWIFEATLVTTNTSNSPHFGASVAIYGDTIVVGAPAAGTTDTGSAFVFARSGAAWTEQARLVASDVAPFDRFGTSVAIDGDTVIVGTPEDDIASNGNQGSAYVFVRSGATWTQQAKITASDGAANDLFGFSVAISAGRALIGARSDDIGANVDQGSAYVFLRSGSTWTQEAKLTASDGTSPDRFGTSVALTETTAVVGAILDDTGSVLDHGSAYVFVRSGATWSQQAKLLASDGATSDEFGSSVAIDGETIVVGAPGDDGPQANTRTGSTYAFVRSGTTWTQQGKMSSGHVHGECGNSVAIAGDTAVAGVFMDNSPNAGSALVFTRGGTKWIGFDRSYSATDNVDAGDRYGESVAISGDLAVVGARFTESPADSGSAYILQRDGSAWGYKNQLHFTAANDHFGRAVAMSASTMAVGAPGDTSSRGRVHLWGRSGSTLTYQGSVTASDSAVNDRFGNAVAVDNDTLVVGSPNDDSDRGSAYVYTRSGTTWSQQQKLVPSDGLPSDVYGYGVAVSGDTIVVGALDDDVNGAQNQGSAYVYTRSAGVWTQQARLFASDGSTNDQFGVSVALDGNTVLIGAFTDDIPGGTGIFEGSAYVFTRSGTVWTQQAKLTGPGNQTENFGYSVALKGDTALVGAYAEDVGANNAVGAAYVFGRIGTTWTRVQRLAAFDGSADDRFGESVALDGDMALVGASFDDSLVLGLADLGSVYAFDIPLNDLPLAVNTNTNTGYTSLASAVGAASSGHSISATPAAYASVGSLDSAGRTLQLNSTGPIRLPSTSNLRISGISGVTSLAPAPGTPIESYGTLRPASSCDVTSDLRVGPGSTLLVGGASAFRLVGADFDCRITSNARFNAAFANVHMLGTGAEQTLEVMSQDIGANALGLDRTIPGHFPIGTLTVGPAPATVRLVDIHDNDGLGQSACEAIYVTGLNILPGCRLMNPNCKTYYRSLFNYGVVDVPGNLVPLCVADTDDGFGTGIPDGGVGIEDLLFYLAVYDAGTSRADVDDGTGTGTPDGGVGIEDLLYYLERYDAGC